jgi:hypothetical protein
MYIHTMDYDSLNFELRNMIFSSFPEFYAM